MILYLCRHAIAEDPIDGDDFHRALTPEGIKKFRQSARGFLKLDPQVGHILTSPLVRARQTADLLAEALAEKKEKVDITPCEPLGIPADLRQFLSELRKHKGNAVAVGHEPTLSEWIGELCFGAVGRCEMKKGAIAAIEILGSEGTLLWHLQPGQLRALA
jgi:phosphohistidine phosphatase